MLSKVSVSNTRIFSYNDEDKEPAIITTGQNFNLTGGSIAAATAAKPLQSCLTLCHSLDSSPTRLPCPWDSPGKNTGVGCRFLLQGMKVKSESEVAQSCLTLSDPMDCSLPGSSVHGIFQAKVLQYPERIIKLRQRDKFLPFLCKFTDPRVYSERTTISILSFSS